MESECSLFNPKNTQQNSQPANLDLQKMRWTEKQTQYPTDPLLGSGGMRMQRFISSKQHKVLGFFLRLVYDGKVERKRQHLFQSQVEQLPPETSHSTAHLLIHRTQESPKPGIEF